MYIYRYIYRYIDIYLCVIFNRVLYINYIALAIDACVGPCY